MSAPVTQTSQNGYTIVTQVIPPQAGQTGTQNISTNPLQRFLKGEPKALGTVQIMIGLVICLFYVMFYSTWVVISYSFWFGLLYICTGSFTVSASNKLQRCVVNTSKVLNVFSAIAAVIGIIVVSLHLSVRTGYRYNYYMGEFERIDAMLLIFSILQFFTSVSITVFACRATSIREPYINVITVVPDSAGLGSVMNPLLVHNTQQHMPPGNNCPPVEQDPPPDYNDI